MMCSATDEAIGNMARERRELAQRLRFFDCSVWLGRPQGFPLAREVAPQHLGEALARHHLTGALISSWRGKVVSPQDGNAQLDEVATSLPEECSVVWTGAPLNPGEREPLPGVGELGGKARGVRLFPKSHNFPLVSWTVGPLCEYLVARGLPLFLWHTELDWRDLFGLAGEFPGLSIVVETQTQKILYHTRPLFALMRERPNVFVELSNFAGAGFIEYAVREFGAERLVYGSFLPVSDPFVPMGMVLDADIPEEDKALIAGANLRRLIGGARP